jgi:flagellin-like hook-associated protein FlgL
MSGIVLSASVRQNLLSLQSTAALLATTQNDLATGNRVNTALDNPTEYFTAQGLNNRASDISNLLDGINNGVQVLQAANTGITSLQGYIATAQSIANQVLQAPTGYSTKSSFSSAAITGATANNLLGTYAAGTNASVTGASPLAAINLSGTPAKNAVLTGTSALGTIGAPATSGSVAEGAYGTVDLSSGTLTFSIAIDGGSPQAISVAGSDITAVDGSATLTAVTGSDMALALNAKINTAEGTTGKTYVSFGAGKLTFTSATTGNSSSVQLSSVSGAAATAAGLSNTASAATGANATNTTFTITGDAGTATVTLAGGTNYTSTTLLAAINTQAGTAAGINATLDATTHDLVLTSTGTAGTADTVTIGTGASSLGFATTTTGHGAASSTAPANVTFDVTGADGTAHAVTLSSGNDYTAADIVGAINSQVGTAAAVHASLNATGALVVASTGTANASDTVTIGTFAQTGNAGINATELGFAAGASVTATGTNPGASPINNLELTIGSTQGGTATDITFGTGAGQISTLNQLNAALAPNNLQASIDTTGVITITTSNNAASAAVGQIGGTATAAGDVFALSNVLGPVEDPNSQATRAGLVAQYNNILQNINTTAQDASYNGVNLLNGDSLNMTFDETGDSKLSIQGFIFNIAGLNLSTLTAGTDFLDSNSANAVLHQLTNASNTLESAASALGSNLSVVQIRQDFNKNLVNVLQTGATNLTIADPNEEAANSQALSTRQSIAVSALALANQSQQSVLQLLRT